MRFPRPSSRVSIFAFGAVVSLLAAFGACSASSGHGGGGTPGTGGTTLPSGGGGAAGGVVFVDAGGDVEECARECSADLHSVIDCNGFTVQKCTGVDGCDVTLGACGNACEAAVNSRFAVGCEYYATDMDQHIADKDTCFAAVIANTWDVAAHVEVEFAGSQLPVSSFARIPAGAGSSLTYSSYNPALGLPPGDVLILFLSGTSSSLVPCPSGVPTAVPSGAQIFQTSDIGHSFRIASDVPVVAYQINPYGGGVAGVTGASLLLPTSVWDFNYVAVMASPQSAESPSMNIVAMEDDTKVTLLPTSDIQGGGKLPAGKANTAYEFFLDKGEQAQFSQPEDLTGSVIWSSEPVGFMAGQQCMSTPAGVQFCDHGEQMVPPVKALGNEYVGVMFRPRVPGDQGIWHLVGAIDGTSLTYSEDVGGPLTLSAGQAVDFITDKPFTVKSQDADHPFMLFTYMSGSGWKAGMEGYGDPDFVLSVPPEQYLSHYVFFTDPSYPETNLVVVRAKTNGKFRDVELDCAGVLTGFSPVGNYEWTRVDLIRHDFQNVGACSTGRHEIKSDGRFGLWVWGWGTPETGDTPFTQNVSYGYPGGMNVRSINKVEIPPTPK